MKCVVLLGFSTTGKSSILGDFREQLGDVVDTLDSDQQVSEQDGGHIYNVYLRFRDGYNTDPSIHEIERREREFLRTFEPVAKPLLLASGPFLPIREPEWSAFVEQVRPVFFYLQKNPEEVLKGLLVRRARHQENPDLASDPGFGCWDQGITTEFRDGRWVLIDRAVALQNIRTNMARMVAIYASLASQTFTWEDRQTDDGRVRVSAAIRQELGV